MEILILNITIKDACILSYTQFVDKFLIKVTP